MNLREGTRRLALLLGVAGAICGGYVSYPDLHSVLWVQGQHDQFEQWANSPVVQQEQKAIQATPPPKIDPNYPDLPPGIRPLEDSINRDGIKTIDWFYLDGKWEAGEIDTEGGYHLAWYPAPSLWAYVQPMLWPVLGFLIPWGAVYVIAWVGAGFVHPSR